MIRESYLIKYFQGQINSDLLSKELLNNIQRTGKESRYEVEDSEVELEVKTVHLIKICDAVLAKELPPEILQDIAFLLISSDSLFWDGSDTDGGRVAEVLEQWSAPEINYSLNIENVVKWREFLVSAKEEILKTLVH